MPTGAIASGWVPFAREIFEYNLLPWFGRRYAPWPRLVAPEHPVDSSVLVLVPEAVYQVFKDEHRVGAHVTDKQLRKMGYPRHPAEAELADVRGALRKALAAGAYAEAAQLTCRAEALHEQIDGFKQALRHGHVAVATDSKPNMKLPDTTGATTAGAGLMWQPAAAGALA